MKKLISVFLTIIMCMSVLSACSADGNESVITVNGETDIDTEIFSYFLNSAYYGVGGFTDSECIEYATSECLKYIAVNTRFAQMGGKLTVTEKGEISQVTNALWRMYGNYFKEAGISKDTFFKIRQYEYFREQLRFALYDTDGTQPINEDYIKQYFTTNYAGIKYFYEELYTPYSDGQIASLSASEKATYDAIVANAERRYDYISGIANYVNSGVYSMDEAFMAVTGEVSADISVSVTVVSREGGSFSPEHTDAMFKQSVGSAFIITNPAKSHVYLTERVDLLDNKYDLYSQYRDECLRAVSEQFFVNEINSWIQTYTAVRHLAAANDCLDRIKSIDRSKYTGTDEYIFKSINTEGKP